MPIPFESALNFAKEKRPISHAKWIEENQVNFSGSGTNG